jgi:putative FmdB family regulatory protein
MPTYHYRCSACGHAFDHFQKFKEDPLSECPNCSGPVRRVPQPVGIVFKGSGWYVTDSRKSNGASKKSPETASASDESKKADSISKTEKEPAGVGDR